MATPLVERVIRNRHGTLPAVDVSCFWAVDNKQKVELLSAHP